MNITHPLTWRKGLFLSATFLFTLLMIVGCKKKETTIGENTIDPNDLLTSAGIDTFQLFTSTFEVDSVISDNPAFALLGSYNDPVFGKVSSEFYTQFRLSGFNPDFGDLNTIAIDSFVLGLEYVGYYGETGNQVFEVFEIIDPNGLHIDSTYYSFSTKQVDSDNLIATGKEINKMDPSVITVIGSDTVDAQLRLQLDTVKARALMLEAMTNTTTFSSNENFSNYFKGLLVRTNNGPQASGEGGVFYFNLNDPLSKATIYYTVNGEAKKYDLLINTEAADFNHVEMDNSGTKVQNVIDNPSAGQVEFYAQSFNTRAAVRAPGLSNIPKNAIIHKAILELPVQYQTGTKYSPGIDASVARKESLTSSKLFSLGSGIKAGFSSSTKSFKVDIREHVQNIVNGTVENTDIVISPILFITTVDRIVFNGPSTGNKAKPKLSVLYTEF